MGMCVNWDLAAIEHSRKCAQNIKALRNILLGLISEKNLRDQIGKRLKILKTWATDGYKVVFLSCGHGMNLFVIDHLPFGGYWNI